MKYAKSNNGLIHLINAANPEYTLCGDAFDIDSEADNQGDAWKDVRKGPVTCPNCARVIQDCKGVRIKVANPS